MGSVVWVVVAAVAFVGSHFLLSHPLRASVVRAVGEGGFRGVYALVAAVTLVWLILAYRAAPTDAALWPAGDVLWALATIVMLVASILLMGSLIGNPAMTGASAGEPRGVFAVTRHPMMWAVALWALCHIAVYPVAKNIVVNLAILILALVGAAMQDRKKEQLQPEMWPAWEARTSFTPFAAMAAGRARMGNLRPHTWAGGVVVWLAATWAHIPLAGWPAGIWRWL